MCTNDYKNRIYGRLVKLVRYLQELICERMHPLLVCVLAVGVVIGYWHCLVLSYLLPVPFGAVLMYGLFGILFVLSGAVEKAQKT